VVPSTDYKIRFARRCLAATPRQQVSGTKRLFIHPCCAGAARPWSQSSGRGRTLSSCRQAVWFKPWSTRGRGLLVGGAAQARRVIDAVGARSRQGFLLGILKRFRSPASTCERRQPYALLARVVVNDIVGRINGRTIAPVAPASRTLISNLPRDQASSGHCLRYRRRIRRAAWPVQYCKESIPAGWARFRPQVTRLILSSQTGSLLSGHFHRQCSAKSRSTPKPMVLDHL
jgi:hypothetical protein